MSKDNKKLIKYLVNIYITVLTTYKLPHNSYSIIQYIIPPIRLGDNSILYLWGLIPLILFIIGIKGLFKIDRFKNENKLVLFLVVLLFLIPLMRWTLDFTRTNYHWIKGDGLKAVDIEESNIHLNSSEDEMVINITLELKDYSRKHNNFKIRIFLPESLSDYTGKEFYDFESVYFTHGQRSITTIQEDIGIKLNDNHNEDLLFDSQWFWEDIEYELYNQEEKIRIMQHGL